MYGAYDAETLEKLINMVHHMHNTKASHEKLFAGQLTTAYRWYINSNSNQGVQHYAINSLLYLLIIKDKYVQMCNEFIRQLCMYTEAIRILAKVSTNSLISPLKLKEILDVVRTTIRKINPGYDIVIKRLHLYYNMKLVTFGMDRDKNLIIQFPVFIQPCTQQLLVLYQIQTVPVPIIDQNPQVDSYMHLQVDKPYIALNSETYISVRQQELRTCQRIGYKLYCEELFAVKHKSKYSCESMICLDLDPEIIKEDCKFTFYYNKTDIIATVLDGGNEIILANWPNDEHIIYSINNDIPVKIPSYPYVLVNRNVLCNCSIEAENNFLLQSLAACLDSISKLIMYFTVNTAFVNYLDQIGSLTETLEFPILKNKTTLEQTLPISLNISKIETELLTAPRTLRDFIHQYNHRKEIFDLEERHDNTDTNLPNRNFPFLTISCWMFFCSLLQ